MKLVYLAAPLFSDAEKAQNLLIAAAIESLASVFLPQRDGHLVSEMVTRGVSVEQAFQRVSIEDLEAIGSSTILVAVLDGQSVDEGVAFEIGYAFALGKVCIGFQTDTRRKVLGRNNPMVEGGLITITSNTDTLLDAIRSVLKQ